MARVVPGETRPSALAPQVRGSIPVFWSEVPNIKYKPKRVIIEGSATEQGFDRHITDLAERYRAVTGINLSGLNPKKSEGKLSVAYAQQAERFAQQSSAFRLVPFDFHKKCGATNYHRLAELWSEVECDYQKFGSFIQDEDGAVRRQAGVFRTNCIDCLDRTNVVQGYLARHQLEDLLRSFGLLSPLVEVASAFPKFDLQFKALWADHGDSVSREYAGTGALKSGFTRTGRRTLDGFLDDGIKSVMRYYLNNFEDGRKQDAYDLLLGAFDAATPKVSPWRAQQASPSLPLLLAAVAAAYALFSAQRSAALEALHGLLGLPRRNPPLLSVALPLSIAVGLLGFVVANGKGFTNRPRLRPDLVQPWTAPE